MKLVSKKNLLRLSTSTVTIFFWQTWKPRKIREFKRGQGSVGKYAKRQRKLWENSGNFCSRGQFFFNKTTFSMCMRAHCYWLQTPDSADAERDLLAQVLSLVHAHRFIC